MGFAGIAPCLDADAEPDTVEIVAWEVLPRRTWGRPRFPAPGSAR